MSQVSPSSFTPVGSGELSRRRFVETLGIAAAATIAGPVLRGQAATENRLSLGMDSHSLRAMGWKAPRFVEYAAQQKLDAVLFNTLRQFESLESPALRKLKESAERQGIQFYIGVGSVAQHSTVFSSEFGSPEELLALGVRVAADLGSPVITCRIGGFPDRSTSGGIEARIDEVVKVIKAVRNRAVDAGIKFAVEDHTADMRSDELLGLIKAAGTDVTGVMLDPGNAVWAMEDPMLQLDLLGPHVLCTSVRDWMVWETPEGATFQWTAIGEGLMDLPRFVSQMTKLCPTAPFNLEIIANSPRPIPFLKPEHWAVYPRVRAADIIPFLALCRRGHALKVETAPAGTNAREFDQQQQRADLERSIAAMRRQGVGRNR